MRLTDSFAELIAYVAYFLRTVEKRQPSYDQVKADIQRLISESQASLDQGQFSQEDYNLARFAIFAWIDEAILGSAWQEKHRWQAEQLQRIYYQTTDAGELFFERLNTIGPHQRDVREVYYLCLAMGFSGRFCREGDDFLLEQLKTSNLKMLTGSAMGVPSVAQGALFPDAYPVNAADYHVRRKKGPLSPFYLLCIGGPVALYLFLFLIYWFILGSIGDNLLMTVPQ